MIQIVLGTALPNSFHSFECPYCSTHVMCNVGNERLTCNELVYARLRRYLVLKSNHYHQLRDPNLCFNRADLYPEWFLMMMAEYMKLCN